MAKKSKKTMDLTDDLELIDVFYIPKPFAEMYRVLREAVAQEVIDILQGHYPKVERVQDSDIEGESIVAYSEIGQETFRYYLNPTNMSAAQAARDSEQMTTYVKNLMGKQ